MTKHYFVYILTNKKNGTFYTGVTSDLNKRIYEHKQQFVEGFSKKHNLKILVYYEIHQEILAAIRREKLIKRWKRSMKIEAINKINPKWKDLYCDIL